MAVRPGALYRRELRFLAWLGRSDITRISGRRARFAVCDRGDGHDGSGEKHPRALALMKAQATVDARPEFEGNVAFVGPREFWRPVEDSPNQHGYHWNSNAETCFPIGENMGRVMVRMLERRPE